jgi:hypothetical protein
MGLAKGGRGQHGGLSEYAAKVGRGKSTITELVNAARVVENCSLERTVLLEKTKHLSAIHALPAECWQARVIRCQCRRSGPDREPVVDFCFLSARRKKS